MILLVLPAIIQAQNSIVTDHFNIYYSLGADETARRVAEVAEEVYAPLASAFDAFDEFSRIDVIVHDEVDFSNGFAMYQQNRVEIWATELDFELRGTSNWIKNVFTHELAHIISLKVASHGFFNIGMFSLGRFNVNPDFYFQIPYYHLVAPTWWVEGVAQYSAERLGNDAWDTHRDMLLRMAALEGDLLTYDEMGVFSGNGLHSEMVYNQGFGLLRYVLEAYGPGKAEELSQHTGQLGFERSIQNVLGVSSGQLYSDWKKRLTEGYSEFARGINGAVDGNVSDSRDGHWPAHRKNHDAMSPTTFSSHSMEGDLIVDGGYLDYFPTISPDGKKIAYISNEGQDFVIPRIRMYDIATGEVDELKDRVYSRLSWTPDSKRLVYNRRKGRYNDLFSYDVTSRKEKRLSAELRARHAAVSPDGKKIAFVHNNDGSSNLAMIDVNGTNKRMFTNFNNGSQCYYPAWSPDGTQIAFGIFVDEDRDIGIINVDSPTFTKKTEAPDSAAFFDSTALKVVIRSDADERDPVWLPDGTGILFSSDRGGVFNIYEYNLASGNVTKRTEVIGGAFSPTISPDGESIVYSGYHAANYNLYKIPRNAYDKTVELDTLSRDYKSIYTGKAVKDLFTAGRGGRAASLVQAMPVLSLSPSFVGNRFTINTINAGMQIVTEDMWGRDAFVGTAIAGKAIKRDLDFNYTLSGYYEKSLLPVRSTNRTFAPTGFLFANKRVINDFDDQTSVTRGDTTIPFLFMMPDGSLDTLDVRFEINAGTKGGLKQRFDFKTYGGGFTSLLGQSHQASFQYVRRDYRWDVFQDVFNYDSTRAFLDIDDTELILDPLTQTVKETIFDSDFFTSHEYYLGWTYASVRPTMDALINPTDGRVLSFAYGRLNTTVADSVIFIQDQEPGLPPNIPVPRKFPLNEYTFRWLEFIGMPIPRHTLGLETLIIYQDQQVPDNPFFDGFFPIRMYLGGQNTMRGYPYFTLRGSKLFFSRAKYVFPIFSNIGKQLWNFHLDRLYGSLFFDIGSMWNFDELTLDNIEDTTWLYDAGFEIRLSMFNYYRIPATAYFQMAWPLKAFEQNGIDKGDHRIYFGMRLGGIF